MAATKADISLEPPTYTDRELFAQLRRFEPHRAYVAAVLAALTFLAIPFCWISASVGAFYLAAAVAPRLVAVCLSAVVSGTASLIAARIQQRKPWRRLAFRRLHIYRARPLLPDGTVWALLPDDVFPDVHSVLARAQLSARGQRTHLPAAPEDAPTLCNRIEITIADALRVPGDGGASGRAQAALTAAGIRARIGGVDVPAGSV